MDSRRKMDELGDNSCHHVIQQENGELLERERREWLWVGSILSFLICVAPAVLNLLALALALVLGCDSVAFDERHVPLCPTRANSQIYVLGFIGKYGWIVSIPASVVVLLISLIGDAATAKK